MPDPSSLPDDDGDTADGMPVGPDLGPAPGTPLWVKVFGVGFLVLVLAFVIMVASGHGPGHHMS